MVDDPVHYSSPASNSFKEKKYAKQMRQLNITKHKRKVKEAKEAKTAAVTVKDTGVKVIRTTFIAVKKAVTAFPSLALAGLGLILLLVIALFIGVFSAFSSSSLILPGTASLSEEVLAHTETKSIKAENDTAEYKLLLKKKVFGNPLIWILGIANFFVYVVRFSVLDWGPTFLKEARGLSLANAGWTVAVFEIFGIIGMLVAGWATDKFFQGKAHRTCVFCMVGTAIFMTIFWLLPVSASLYTLIIVLAMAGFFIYGPQALIGIAAANQATKKAAATANGLTGMFGYASVFVSGLGVGAMVDWINASSPGKGWDYVFLIMIGIAIIGALVFMIMWNARRDGYDEETEETNG